MLITLAVISGTLLLAPILQGAVATGLGANEAVQLINREKAVVIDVCEAAEFAAGHVVGAKNIPLGVPVWLAFGAGRGHGPRLRFRAGALIRRWPGRLEDRQFAGR